MTDIDRMLREAMSVEPSGDFAARIRTRVAGSPRESRALMPRFALAGIMSAVLAAMATNVWRGPDTSVVQSVLPHRDLIVLAQPTPVMSSPPLVSSRAVSPVTDVVVSRSEMLALQQLFSGTIVAPPPLLPPAIELAIPELAIAPLSTSTTEGEHR